MSAFDAPLADERLKLVERLSDDVFDDPPLVSIRQRLRLRIQAHMGRLA
jgi:hypothetical protein